MNIFVRDTILIKGAKGRSSATLAQQPNGWVELMGWVDQQEKANLTHLALGQTFPFLRKKNNSLSNNLTKR